MHFPRLHWLAEGRGSQHSRPAMEGVVALRIEVLGRRAPEITSLLQPPAAEPLIFATQAGDAACRPSGCLAKARGEGERDPMATKQHWGIGGLPRDSRHGFVT